MGPLSGHISPSRFTHCSVNLSLSLVHLSSLSFRNFSAKPGGFSRCQPTPVRSSPWCRCHDMHIHPMDVMEWQPQTRCAAPKLKDMSNDKSWVGISAWCIIYSIYKFMAKFWSQSSKVFSIVLGLRSWRMKCHSAGKLHYLLFIGGQISHAMLDYPVRKNFPHICCTWILNIHFSSHCKYGPFVYHGPF